MRNSVIKARCFSHSITSIILEVNLPRHKREEPNGKKSGGAVGRKGLSVSLHGLEPDDALEALLETPPPSKEKQAKET